jgi:hypothetical protein
MTVTHSNQKPNPAGPRSISILSAGATLTNNAAALTDYSAALRPEVNLTPFKFVRLHANVTTGSAVGATHSVRLQYSVDGGSTFAYFDATNSEPACSLTTAALVQSAWVAIPAAAQKDLVVLRLATINGDGAADPVVGSITVEFAA